MQYFIDQIDELIAKDNSTPFTVITANVDDFKNINDSFGHNDRYYAPPVFRSALNRYNSGNFMKGVYTLQDLFNLYQSALKFIDQTISSGIVPEGAQNMYASALITDKGSIYTALNRVCENGFGESGCSEREAAGQAAMNNETRITAIVTVSLADRSIVMPCESCCKYLSKLDPQNSYCEVMNSENTSVMLKELMSQKGYVLDPTEIFGDDMFSGFDTPAPPPTPVQTINPEPDQSAAPPPQNDFPNNQTNIMGGQPVYPNPDPMIGGQQPMYQNGMINGQPMYQNPMMNGQFMYQNAMMNGQPMYQNPMMNGQPMYQNGMVNDQPVYQNGMVNGQPMYQNGMVNGQPVYQNGMVNGQPMYQNGMVNGQPVYQNGMVNGQPIYHGGMVNGQNPYQSAMPVSGGNMSGYANNANSIYINPTSSTPEDTAFAPAPNFSESPNDSPQNNVYQQKLKNFLNISESQLHVPPPAEEPAAPPPDDSSSADPSKNHKNMKQMKKELAKAKKAAKKGFFS